MTDTAYYYILSLKHTRGENLCLWWGPGNCGYVADLDSAGVYSQQQIDEKPDYYNNGVDTVAVRMEEAHKHQRFVVFASGETSRRWAAKAKEPKRD